MLRHAINTTLLLSALLCSGSMFAATAQLTVLLVGGDDIPKMTQDKIADLFTLSQKRLPNNKRALLVAQPLESSQSMLFTQKLFNYYPYQLKRLWDQAIFTGRARQPEKLNDNKQVLHFIKKTPNALGYVVVSDDELLRIKESYNVVAVIH